MDERADQCELLLHSAGQAVRQPSPERRQLGHRQELIAPRLVSPDAVHFGKERNVFVHGEIAVQAEALRSEERRVGKECRARWGAARGKEKKEGGGGGSRGSTAKGD